MTLADAPVLYRPGRVAHLVFNRPRAANALTSESWALLADALARFEEDPQARVLVLAGAGGAFCSGVDLSGDIVIASDRVRFGAVFSRLGLTPDGGLSWLLPRIVGAHKAKELTLFGRLVESSEAQRLGLANIVVPAGELDAVADDWCERLATCHPAAAAGTLQLLDRAWNTTLVDALEQEAAAQQRSVAALRG